MINVLAAVLNVALNFWAIPRYGILGAAYATLVSQAARVLAVWLASQVAFPLPFDYAGTGLALGLLATTFAAGDIAGMLLIARLPNPWGWGTATCMESALVLLAIAGLWRLPVFDADERAAIVRIVSVVFRPRR